MLSEAPAHVKLAMCNKLACSFSKIAEKAREGNEDYKQIFNAIVEAGSIVLPSELIWVDSVLVNGPISLLQKMLSSQNYDHRSAVVTAVLRELPKVFAKALEGQEGYKLLLQTVLKDRYTIPKAQCDEIFRQCLDKPECLTSIALLQQLLTLSYSSGASIPTWYLHKAISHRDLQLLEIFKAYPSNVNELDSNGNSLLEKAFSSAENRVALVNFLLKKGAHVNAQFSGNSLIKGHTPLTYTVSIADPSLFNLLGNYDPNLVNNDHFSALEIVLLYHENPSEWVTALYLKGANLNA